MRFVGLLIGVFLISCGDDDGERFEMDAGVTDGRVEAAASDAGCGRWYADCDGDGYALVDAESMEACSKPTDAVVGCELSTATWTSRDPNESALSADCYDLNALAHPEPLAADGFSVDRGDGSFDYNCDGTHTKVYNPTNATAVLPTPGCYMTRPTVQAPSADFVGPFGCGQVGMERRCAGHDTTTTCAELYRYDFFAGWCSDQAGHTSWLIQDFEFPEKQRCK